MRPAILLLLLAGCASFEDEPLSPEQTSARFEARSLDEAKLKIFLEKNLENPLEAWPLQKWNFEQLALVALHDHPSLDVGRAEWAVARAGVVTAGERPNPALNVGPQYSSNAERGVSPWVVPFTIDVPIEMGGKRGYRTERAVHEAESARLKLYTLAWQVRSHLRSAMLEDASARRRLELLEGVKDIQQEVLDLLAGRLAAGAIATTELTAARVALGRTEADLAEAQRQAAMSRADVAGALGLPLRALDGRQLEFDLSAASEQGELLESADMCRRAVLGRADLLAALADYAASQSALQLEVARQYPDIHLGPGYEYDQGAHKWGLGFAIDLPVFHCNEGPIAEAEARRRTAAARFLALQAGIIGEIERAKTARQASRDALKRIEALLAEQRSQVRSAEARLAAGAADQLDLASARLEVALTELLHLDARVHCQKALGELEDAVQVPLEDLHQVEQNPRPEENHP